MRTALGFFLQSIGELTMWIGIVFMLIAMIGCALYLMGFVVIGGPEQWMAVQTGSHAMEAGALSIIAFRLVNGKKAL